MAKNARIKITKDGPYLVTGSIPLIRMIIETDNYGDPYRLREVERYPLQERYALCRCGKSINKPYCDGAHTLQRFNGTETASRERYLENVKEYLGPELKLTDRPELCARAHSDRPGFREIAIEEAANCPSGRLVVWDTQGNPIEPHYEPSIVLTEHDDGSPGPLWIRGEVEIESVARAQSMRRETA
jgi:CDGSH-type Zn-finger protein